MSEKMSSVYRFTVEYAKSNHAECRKCKINIGKGQLRIGIMVPSPYFDGRFPVWHHANCFWKEEKLSTIKDLHGFDRLRWEDQEEIRNRVIGKKGSYSGRASSSNGKYGVANANVFYAEYSKSAMSKCKNCQIKIKKNEIRIGKKNGGFYHVKCFVESSKDLNMKFVVDSIEGFFELSDEDRDMLQKLLKQALAKKRADPIENCSKTALKTIEVDLQKEEEERLKIKEQSDALWKIKDSLQATVKSKDMATLLEANGQEVPVQSSISERLADCMLFGGLVQCKECNNGQLVYSTSKNAYMCTGSISAFTKCQFETQDPERKPLVIPHEMKEEYPYLASFKFKKGVKRYFPMKRENPTKSLFAETTKQEISNGGFNDNGSVSSAHSSTNLFLKTGVAVDPDSDMTSVAHVFVDKENQLFSVVLNMTDVQEGRNSFYKLQLLEHGKQKKFWVFRAWGRVGTTIGGNKLDAFNSDLESAKESFKTIYTEKTGNAWEQRHNFVKYPNRFMPVEVDYSSEEKKIESNVSAGSKSNLDNAIKNFITESFNIEEMEETMKDFEKMPLGQLSKIQIEKAYEVLADLQKALGEQSASQKTQILDCSNRFYTLIPHDFGMKKPTLLDTCEQLQSKMEMLDTLLLEIETTRNILKSEGDTNHKDPVDVQHANLATDMQVVEMKGTEFKVVRYSEDDRFIKSKSISNNILLSHGRRMNSLSILSRGLRISPATGYMFGKGIYIADMISKSSNYCFTTKSNNMGYLLLSGSHLSKVIHSVKSRKWITRYYPKPRLEMGWTNPKMLVTVFRKMCLFFK